MVLRGTAPVRKEVTRGKEPTDMGELCVIKKRIERTIERGEIGYDAEICAIEHNDQGCHDYYYISTHAYKNKRYGVSRKSIFEQMERELKNYDQMSFDEKYSDPKELKQSRFCDFFNDLDTLLGEVGQEYPMCI